MSFFTYMFDPTGQPWYTGAFWSNQVQWTIVTLPSLLVLLVRMETHNRHMKRRLEQLLQTKKAKADR